jgi:hypothetical protein
MRNTNTQSKVNDNNTAFSIKILSCRRHGKWRTLDSCSSPFPPQSPLLHAPAIFPDSRGKAYQNRSFPALVNWKCRFYRSKAQESSPQQNKSSKRLTLQDLPKIKYTFPSDAYHLIPFVHDEQTIALWASTWPTTQLCLPGIGNTGHKDPYFKACFKSIMLFAFQKSKTSHQC